MEELDAPMVYLAPEKHAFLVLGDGTEPVITWSRSYRLACEQADIHGGLVVAVPVLRDSSWRAPHAAEGRRAESDAGIAVPAPTALDPTPPPLSLAAQVARVAEATAERAVQAARTADAMIEAGYPLGRASRGGQGNLDGWSSKRDAVVGEDHVPVGPASGAVLGRASVPQRGREYQPTVSINRWTGVEPAPVLPRRVPSPTAPMPRTLPTQAAVEAALLRAFGHDDAWARAAVDAFHAASANDSGTLLATRAGLRGPNDTPGDPGLGARSATGL